MRSPVPRSRGAALLMVVFILGALALLATPFLVAMVLQEKASRSYLSSVQARAGAVGARNFAVAQLVRTHEALERGSKAPPFDDPAVDTFEEVFVPIDTRQVPAARGRTTASPADFFPEGVTNPQGTIWGLEVQDEQGKLHRRSAPDYAAARLAGAVAAVGADEQNFFTDHAPRPSAWVCPQNIRGVNGNFVYVDDVAWFNRGSRIRLTDGTRHVETLVEENQDWRDDAGRYFAVRGGLGGVDPNYAWVEVERRHAVNLNTARFETLQAMFEGLRLRRSPEEITRDEAARIADLLLKRPVRGDADFRALLVELRAFLTDTEIAAFALNSRAPSHLALRHTEMRQRPDPNDPSQTQAWEEWFDPRGTVPYTWRTENTYLLDASGVVNTPAGTVSADARFREIVSVAPPERLLWFTESQSEFEEHLHSDGFAMTGHSDATRGYPYGHKVLTYPARPWLRSPAFPVGEPPGAGPGGGAPGNPPTGVRPAPAKDRRRLGGPGRAWVKHFDDDASGAEGRLLSGPLSEPVAGNQALETNSNRASDVRTFRIDTSQGRLDLTTGGVEFWFKFPGAGDRFLFDLAEAEYENRLACFLRGGQIILRACDATIERKAAEVRAPFIPEPDTWHHLGAYWDSTRLGGVALFIDGHPVGRFAHYDDQDRPIIAELAQDLNATDTDIPVANGGNFPPSGVVLVGAEAIEYDGFSGSSFRNCVRGARRSGPDPDGRPTEGWAHPARAKVVLFGYANPLVSVTLQWGGQGAPPVVVDRVTAGRATLGAAFGANTFSVVNKPPNPLATPPDPGGIGPADPTIPVMPGTTQDFPSSGYVKINDEAIFYSGTTPVAFTGCQRGQVGTTAAAHPHASQVSLFGFQVSSTAGYLNPAVVQIDDEWFAPVQATTGTYFTGVVAGGRAVGLQRGVYITARQAHAPGAKVLPVFAVRNPWCGAELAAYPTARDTVTLVDQPGNKEEKRVRVVRNQRRDPNNGNWLWSENLVALDDFVGREYAVDGPFTRLLKFPSGELSSDPRIAAGQATFTINGAQVGASAGGGGATAAGGGSGAMMIDELRYHEGVFTVNALAQAVTENDDTLAVTNASLPAGGGLVVMGDEVIAYRERDGQSRQLRRCQRGFLGTPAGVHDRGEGVFALGMIPVGVLEGPCSGNAAAVDLQGNARGFAPEGYVQVDNEVIGYTRNRNGTLEMPRDRRGDGILRGRFGTAAAAHGNEAVACGIPFRYWDRYRPRLADSQMVCYQAAKSARGATWRRLCWGEDVRDKNLILVVQARFDGRPAWDDAPRNRPGGLYEFSVSDTYDLKSVGADQVEVRVLFGYRSGSYHPANSWKRAPTLLHLGVEYAQPTMTLYHEER